MEPLILLHVFPSFGFGGQETRTAALMEALGPRFQHVVASISGVTDMASRVSTAVHLKLAGCPRSANPLRMAMVFAKLIREQKPDVVLTYNWGSVDAVLGAWLAGHSYVLHAEDGFGPEEAEHRFARRVWYRRIVLRHAAGVVVPSRNLRGIALNEFRLPARKVLYVPNGVDTARFKPAGDAAAVRRRLGLDPHRFTVGSVGSLRPEKDYGVFLEALARIPADSVRAVLAGDGPCRADLEALSRSLNLGNVVRFLGPTSKPEEVYPALDVFVLSSKTEQMPISLLEAMSSGVAAVCSDVGDCAAMLEGAGPPTLVPRGDAGALAAALEALRADPDRRSRIGATLRQKSVAEYSFETMVERYRELYTRGR